MARILLIDDDEDFSEELVRQLGQLGHEFTALDNAEDGLRLLIAGEKFDLMLLDYRMPCMNGLEFLAALKSRNLWVAVILMTSAHKDETAIQATKMGAFGYVIKPLEFHAIVPEMEPEIKRVLKIHRPVPLIPISTADARQSQDDSALIGGSKAMLDVLRRIALLEGDESVLILGETGTGKDVVATTIHSNSPRNNHPFVAVNCSALSPNLLESELFGHEKNAFTGADRMRKGYFEHADGGTLFLDEVGDMPPPLQPKLLRVLQNREITRMGSCEPIEVNVRVLAATSRDLTNLVRQGSFREDLFYRLEGMTISIPPLREREGDVERLARHLLRSLCREGESIPTLHPDALRVLRGHRWPGNVRQLNNVLRRARVALRARCGTEIVTEDLDFGTLDAAPTTEKEPGEEDALAGLRRAVAWAWQSDHVRLWDLLQQRLECELLRHALAQPGLSEVKRAERLGIARNTLRAREEKYDLKAVPSGQ